MPPQGFTRAAPPSGRRVFVLSPGGAFVSALMALLARRGTIPDALMLYAPGEARAWWRSATPARRALGLPLLPARWMAGRLRRRLAARRLRGAARVVLTGALNGRRMASDLRRMRPDAVVLAHCGLLAPRVIAAAGGSVVNVHPGLLPWIRGSSPLANSLLRRIPLGCTAFRVDAGIDTGRILLRRLLPVEGGETAEALRAALFGLWVEMTADLVAAASAGELPDGFAQEGRFPLCRALPGPPGRIAVEEAVGRGAPKSLFERWRPLCAPAGLTLPAGADVPLADG